MTDTERAPEPAETAQAALCDAWWSSLSEIKRTETTLACMAWNAWLACLRANAPEPAETAPLAGWNFKHMGDLLGSIEVVAPNGYSTVVTKLDRNPANLLYMIAEAALAEPSP